MEGELLSNKAEAHRVLDSKVAELRTLGYERLKSMRQRALSVSARTEISEVTADSGQLYQLATQVFWDDKRGGNLRVLVTLFEDRLASRTMVDDFIISPDGTFVGE